MLTALRSWTTRRWWSAAGAAVLTAVVVAVPTAMVPTPVFGREVPTTWWAWPTLAVIAVLGGLLLATYVREPGAAEAGAGIDRAGSAGGLLAFFAVGCPVCNKVVLLALGYSGALQWFAPVQPVLAVGGVALLAWALRARLRGQVACPLPPAESQAAPQYQA